MSSTNIINPNLVPITVGLESTGILEKMYISKYFQNKKNTFGKIDPITLIFHK